MKFQSYEGKRVWTGNKEIVFGAEPYETKDKEEIEALKRAMEVTQVGGDGTDGSGNKVEVADRQTLEPVTSPEADNLTVTNRTSDAEQLTHLVHDANADGVILSPELPGHEPNVAANFVAEHIHDSVQNDVVAPAGSTAAVDAEVAKVREENDGKVNTEQYNEAVERATTKEDAHEEKAAKKSSKKDSH
jgi:hypothetical protein